MFSEGEKKRERRGERGEEEGVKEVEDRREEGEDKPQFLVEDGYRARDETEIDLNTLKR